jgi:hypothetical protein
MDNLNKLHKAQLCTYVQKIEKAYGEKVKSIVFYGSRQEQWTLNVNVNGTFTRNVKADIDIDVVIELESGTTVVDKDFDDIDLWAEEIALLS